MTDERDAGATAQSEAERASKKCVAAVCVCGGWVMLAVTGHSKSSDRDTWREAGKLAGKGFAIRSPLTVEECRAIPVCKHRGDCTTNPERVATKQEELALAASGRSTTDRGE